MNQHAVFRRAVADDVEAIVELEVESYSFEDEDFGVVCLSPHAWTEWDVWACLDDQGCQVWVVEDDEENLVAWFAYERSGDDAYLVRRLIVHPEHREEGFGRTVLHRLYQRIVRSERRKTLRGRVWLGDADTSRWMLYMGFKSRLVLGGWHDGDDAVEWSFTTQEHFDPDHDVCEEMR